MEQLDVFIYNAIESLKNNKEQPNEDTIYATTNKNITSATLIYLKEILSVLLDKEKFLNKSHWGKNSYYKMQNDDNTSRQTHLTPTQLPKTATLNKILTFL